MASTDRLIKMKSHMHANDNAPVFVRISLEIEAAPEKIWNIISDLEKWPAWNPKIKAVTTDGAFFEGMKFKWKAGPGIISSELKEIEQPARLAWTGKTIGIKAIHVWKLEPINGKTLVTTEESWEGIHVKFFRKYFRKMLEKSIQAGLKYLKIAAEQK